MANTKVLRNGAVYDMDKKRIVANPGGGTTAITQATASAMATLRHQKLQEQAEQAAMEAASDHDPGLTQVPAGWIRPIVKARYKAAIDPKNSRGVESAKFILSVTGYEQAQAQDLQPARDADFVRAVKELIETIRGDVVDGEVIG